MELTDWSVLKPVQLYILKTTRLAFVFGKNGSEALLVTHADRVYAIGKNENGYLGLGDEIPRAHETEVKFLSGKNVKGFTTGGHPEASKGIFVIAYLQDGTVYEWGCVPGCAKPLLTPHEVLNLKRKVVDVACGISHCVALCENGEIYTWGVDVRGNLGRDLVTGYTSNIDPTAKHLMAGRVRGILDYCKAVKIACGAYFSVVILDDNRIVSWGCNRFGQLGIGKSDLPFISFPTYICRLQGSKLLKLVCCYDSVFALDVTNTLFFWGSNQPSYIGALIGAGVSPQVDSPVKYGGQRKYLDIGATYLFDLVVLQTDGGHVIHGTTNPNVKTMKYKSISDVFFYHASHMYQPLYPAKSVRTLSDVLAFEFDNPEKSDLTVTVEKKNIYVHKTILLMRSGFLRAMIENNTESDEKIMIMAGHSYEVIYTYLKFLYTDNLAINLDLAIDLLKLSDEYCDDDLKAKCVEIIMERVTATSVVDVYPLLSKIRDTEKLIPICIDIAAKNFISVVNSDQFNRNWDIDVLKHFLTHLAEKLSNIRVENLFQAQ